MLSKSEMLAEGISRNAKELASKNIHINTDKILSLRKELESAAQKQESVEMQLTEAREKAHRALDELKQYQAADQAELFSGQLVPLWPVRQTLDYLLLV